MIIKDVEVVEYRSFSVEDYHDPSLVLLCDSVEPYRLVLLQGFICGVYCHTALPLCFGANSHRLLEPDCQNWNKLPIEVATFQ